MQVKNTTWAEYKYKHLKKKNWQENEWTDTKNVFIVELLCSMFYLWTFMLKIINAQKLNYGRLPKTLMGENLESML